MIASLRGPVLSIGLDHVVVGAGGVGLAVRTVPSMLTTMRIGEEIELSTTLVVREDSLTLYGFTSPDGKALFELVQSVSGVGPKIALSLLAVFEPAELRTALASGDAKALTRTPGIGKKSAERLILELQDKVQAAPTSPSADSTPITPGHNQIIDALVGLGFSANAAGAAVARVMQQRPQELVTNDSMSRILRESLAALGKTR